MQLIHKISLNLFVIVSLLILFYVYLTNEPEAKHIVSPKNKSAIRYVSNNVLENPLRYKFEEATMGVQSDLSPNETNNVWCIFTKVATNALMKHKFERFAKSLIGQSTVFLTLHVITDESSKTTGQKILKSVRAATGKNFNVSYYDVKLMAEELEDIIVSMQPFFSSQPGTYYSDALFFLSLGLHRIAKSQTRAIMFDADVKILTDIAQLFQEFERFSPDALFGLAPELTPVYQHVLYIYKSKNKETKFGEPISEKGYPGVNSGVIMFRMDRIKKSQVYNNLLKKKAVSDLTGKYSFKGHLGDQDFYTLLGMEHPKLIHLLDCGWNRQLCTWWKYHGYQDVFDHFFRCDGDIKIYHGNCNTPIPNN